MVHRRILIIFAIWVLGLAGLLVARGPAQAKTGPAQAADATATPVFSGGVLAIVKSDDQDEINVRAGPNVDYALVGKLRAGEQVPALGRSAGGDWVQISYPGGPNNTAWVYAYLVDLTGAVPVVVPPPTPTPLTTPTIDPTLAAQFLREVPATRLPTFTPPAPLAIATFQPEAASANQNNLLMAYLIIGLVGAGILGLALSFIRLR